MQKTIILLILFFFSNDFVYSQNSRQWIINDSVKYGVGEISGIDPKFVIVVKMNKEKRNQIKLISKNEWLELFVNNETDWAANLLLYYLYKKSAIKYVNVIRTKDDWRNLGQREDDIQYWKDFLQHTSSP